jgi:hypothetical protein
MLLDYLPLKDKTSKTNNKEIFNPEIITCNETSVDIR